jgi:hypothetical protein
MKKPLVKEARDQSGHFIAGGILTFLFGFTGIPLLWCIPIVFIISLLREWDQHKSIYLPKGGSLVDILFFVLGSAIFVVVFYLVRFYHG